MKTQQLQLDFSLLLKSPTVKSIKVGECFMWGVDLYIKVAPVKSLCHSTMVHEVLVRGDCFVVSLATGVLTIINSDTEVAPLDSRFQYRFKTTKISAK